MASLTLAHLYHLLVPNFEIKWLTIFFKNPDPIWLCQSIFVCIFSIFDLINIHLFHDASNIVAMESVSSVLFVFYIKESDYTGAKFYY